MAVLTTELRNELLIRSVLVVAAHPDDETIGCGALLAGLDDGIRKYVVHVTDGAPRDQQLFPEGVRTSREAYASMRREEALSALSMARIDARRLYSLGAVDQEASFELPRLHDALTELLRELRPDVVIAHAYEGGHPDHDAASFLAHKACATFGAFTGNAPLLVEMTGYHSAAGRLVTGHFLPSPTEPEAHTAHDPVDVLRRLASMTPALVRYLPSAQLVSKKAAMMGAFASQKAVLRAFGHSYELFRHAPRYDFSRAPHEGPLHYERLGWKVTGEVFRHHVRLAEKELVP